MSDLEQAKALLAVAQRDLKALNGMLDADTFADAIFGFHVQQSAEKLLKTWLAAFEVTYPLTHNLDLLFQCLEDLGGDVSKYRELSDFTPFAVQLRYSEIDMEDAPVDRKQAIAQVQSLFEHVESIVQEKLADEQSEE